MCTNEIFEEVLSVVCDVTGIERADVLANKDEVSTDARCILVRYLSRLMPCVTIAKLLGRTRQGIGKRLSSGWKVKAFSRCYLCRSLGYG